MIPDDTITFRPIRAEDVDAVRALQKASWTALAQDTHTRAQMAAHAALIDAPDYDAALLSNNIILAWRGDRVIGSAGWCDMPDDPSAARIRKVFVDADAAGTGLGRALVEQVEASARGRGRSKFTVRSNANAEGFYAALGYRPIRRGTMPAPGADLPVVFMEKRP